MKTTFPEDDDYEIGYGKPPLHSRFPKGQSGNPNGRPKKNRSHADLLRELLEAKIRVGVDKMTKREALYLSLINDAIKGKASARNTVFSLMQNDEEELEAFEPSFDDKIEWWKSQKRMSDQLAREKAEAEKEEDAP